MLDRVPTKPNRYAVYDDAHNFLRYEYHERADEPTQVGDALNKANLLPDDVASALGLTGNPQVKDALEKIKTLIDANTTLANSKAKIVTGSYTGTGTYGKENPISIAIPEGAKTFMMLCPWSRPTAYPKQWRFDQTLIDGYFFGGLPISLTSISSDSFSQEGKGLQVKKTGGAIVWYHSAGAVDQCNKVDVDYFYMFICG